MLRSLHPLLNRMGAGDLTVQVEEESDIDEIVNVTNQEVASPDKIAALIESLTRTMQTTAAHARQVSASAEETKASMKTVASTVEETI